MYKMLKKELLLIGAIRIFCFLNKRLKMGDNIYETMSRNQAKLDMSRKLSCKGDWALDSTSIQF